MTDANWVRWNSTELDSADRERARFTDGAQVEMRRGAFRIDAEGSVRDSFASPQESLRAGGAR